MNHQTRTGSGTCKYRSPDPPETTLSAPSLTKTARSSNNKRIPVDVREQIVKRYQHGESVSRIANTFGISECGVRKTWSRFQTTGTVKDRTSSGKGAPAKPVPSSGRDSSSTSLPLKEEEGVDGDSGVGSQETASTMGCGSSVSRTEGGRCLNGDSPVNTADYNTLFPAPGEGPLNVPSHETEKKEPIINSLLFDTPQLDPDRIGPVPEKYNLLTDRRGRSRRSLNRPYPREHMLPPIHNCPLATIKEQKCNHDNRHVENIAASKTKPLYGECLWGFPYGRAPEAGCYESCLAKEENPISVDPANPIAKTLLADLGYSTQVFFNACCKPPELLDRQKVACNLPFTLQPSTLAESTRQFFLVLISVSNDPKAIFDAIPEGSGPVISVQTLSGQTVQKSILAPVTLSQYWSLLMDFTVEKLTCCENFISASPPSTPCLVCHPFVRNPTPPSSPSMPLPPLAQSSPARSSSMEPPSKKRCESASGDGDVVPPREVDPRYPPVVQETMDTTQQGLPTISSVSSPLLPTSLPTPSHSDPSVSLVFKQQRFPIPSHQQPHISSMMLLLQMRAKGGVVPFQGQQSVPSRVMTSNPTLSQWPRPLAFPQGLSPSPPIGLQIPPQYGSRPSEQLLNPESPPTSFSSILHPQPEEGPSLLDSVSSGQLQSNGRSTSTSVTSESPHPPPPLLSVGVAVPDNSTSVKPDMKSLVPSEAVSVPIRNEENTVDVPSEERSEDIEILLPSTKIPKEWSVEEVRKFVHKITDIKCSQVFQEQEVDGQAMLLLTTDVMVTMMKIKIGPALKLMKFIGALKEKFGS